MRRCEQLQTNLQTRTLSSPTCQYTKSHKPQQYLLWQKRQQCSPFTLHTCFCCLIHIQLLGTNPNADSLAVQHVQQQNFVKRTFLCCLFSHPASFLFLFCYFWRGYLCETFWISDKFCGKNVSMNTSNIKYLGNTRPIWRATGRASWRRPKLPVTGRRKVLTGERHVSLVLGSQCTTEELSSKE